MSGAPVPLLLLHGTNSSRAVWAPLLPELTARRPVLAIDLPGHGDAPPTSLTPPAWAAELEAWLDETIGRGERIAVAGHSAGGWTALELAKRGRASAVLALAPAGLWRKRSPRLTDLRLNLDWRLGRLAGEPGIALLRRPRARAVALRTVSARPSEVSAETAIAGARAAAGTHHFPQHFAATRVLRFTGGRAIGADVPVRIVWGEQDRIALRRASRSTDELPSHASVETWSGCGHMVPWDRPRETLAALLALPA